MTPYPHLHSIGRCGRIDVVGQVSACPTERKQVTPNEPPGVFTSVKSPAETESRNVAGEVIDLFTRRRLKHGEDSPVPEDYESEEEFVLRFMDVHLGEFLAEVKALEDATTIDQLESQIRRIKRLVAAWRIPK